MNIPDYDINALCYLIVLNGSTEKHKFDNILETKNSFFRFSRFLTFSIEKKKLPLLRLPFYCFIKYSS